MNSTTTTTDVHITSANGDGLQAIEAAANVYRAFSALGVAPIVEIIIRVQPEAAAPREPLPPNPTLAAQDPAQWDLTPHTARKREEKAVQAQEDLLNLDAVVAGLDSDQWTFRQLSKEVREALVLQHGRRLKASLQRAPSQSEFDRSKPEWMSSAASATLVWNRPWAAFQALFSSDAMR